MFSMGGTARHSYQYQTSPFHMDPIPRRQGDRKVRKEKARADRSRVIAWAAEAKVKKVALQKSSLSFGNDITNYTSENRNREMTTESLTCIDPKKNAEDKARNIAKKKALQVTNLVLGNENTPYRRSSELLDPTGRMDFFRGVLNTKEASLLRKSNVTFGEDETPYESTQCAQDKWDWKHINGARPPPIISNRHLKPNFTLGDFATDYTSCAMSDFVYRAKQEDMLAIKKKAEELKTDLRASHYDLGKFKMDFSTTTADQQMDRSDPNAVGTQSISTAMLQKTHIEMGKARVPYESMQRSAQWDVEETYDEDELGY